MPNRTGVLFDGSKQFLPSLRVENDGVRASKHQYPRVKRRFGIRQKRDQSKTIDIERVGGNKIFDSRHVRCPDVVSKEEIVLEDNNISFVTARMLKSVRNRVTDIIHGILFAKLLLAFFVTFVVLDVHGAARLEGPELVHVLVPPLAAFHRQHVAAVDGPKHRGKETEGFDTITHTL